MLEALLGQDPGAVLSAKEMALLGYVKQLTLKPQTCCKEDVDALRGVGASDVEIHATVQLASYFNYINRVADALGVDLEPEMLAES